MGDIFKPFLGEVKPKRFKHWAPKAINEPLDDDLSKHISEEALNKLKQAAFDEAYQCGMEQAQHDLLSLKDKLIRLVEQLIQPLKLVDKEINDQLIEIILLVCKHCLQSELSLHPEKILAVLDEIKKYLPIGSDQRKLYLSPSDAVIVREVLADVDGELEEGDILDDALLSPGEYRYVTETAELDGRLQSRLDNILDRIDNAEDDLNG